MDKAMPISASRIEPNYFTTGLCPIQVFVNLIIRVDLSIFLKKKFLTMTKLCLTSVVRTW